MAINPLIALMGQTPDMTASVERGMESGNNFMNMLVGRQANRMRDLDGYDKQKAFADTNFFGRQLRGQLKQDQAAALQTQLQQQKALADIGKVQSEAFKNNTQGRGFGLENSSKTQAAIESVIQQAAMTGDPMQVRLGLHRLQKTGLITPEQYQQETAIVQAMTPDELRKYAQGSALTNKEVAPYLYQTQNNAADNTQSDINNQRSTNASIYSTDVSAETANKNRAQQQGQFDANLYVQQNKPLDYFTAADGTRYAVYANGQGIPVSGPSGEPVKAQQTGSLTAQNAQREETQRLQRVDAILPEIEKILPNSTSSYVGAGADFLGRAIGYSTDGAKATAQLKTLAGQLVSLMPKMSGPQSDKDVAMYKEMAGNLADETQPIQTRMAALQTIKELNNKYKGMNQQSGVPYANAGGQTQSTFNLFD